MRWDYAEISACPFPSITAIPRFTLFFRRRLAGVSVGSAGPWLQEVGRAGGAVTEAKNMNAKARVPSSPSANVPTALKTCCATWIFPYVLLSTSNQPTLALQKAP